jgi:tRNA threonylcarbamoyladenosine biosynthesis protein TsaB
MSRILNIETATDVCSVSISEGGKTIAIKERTEGRSHATILSVFIRDLFAETGLKPDALDAVAVSQGPGSYTGLRIGVSTAKGICYGSKLPLIAVSSLESLTSGLIREFNKIGEEINESVWLLPMIDARRMEVYTAFFDYRLNQVKETHAMIIDPDTFNEPASAHRLILFGSGAEKLKGLINHPDIRIVPEIKLSALDMASLAEKKFGNKAFEDLAYFEPCYLKDFMTTIPKKKIF